MKLKRGLSALLALIMVLSLAACGGSSNNETKSSSGTSGTKDTAGGSSASNEETYTVVMGYIGDTLTDEVKVEEAINAIIEPELNMKIDLRPFSWGTYTQELQLILSGDEKLDITPIIISNAAGYVSNGQVRDLTELIEQYGTNIKNYVDPDFLTCPNINGFTYGVTSMREQITWEGIMMRRDIVEELGYTVDENGFCNEIDSLDDLDELFAKVKEAYPSMYMLGSTANGTPLFRWETFDHLTDDYGVLMDFGQSTDVVNLFETQEFKDMAQKLYEWNQLGYISKDGATTTEVIHNQIKADSAFAYFTPLKAGAIEQDELNTGKDLCAASLYGKPYITGYSVNFFTWGIARNSTQPEKAFQLLDYIYGSAEVMNLLNWGIEGEHYQFVDEEKGIITYPDGVDVNNKTWGLNIGWELPNQEIAYVWEGEDPSKWELQRQYISEATRSLALGFAYDSTDVSNQLTALANVRNEYFDQIGSGNAGEPEAVIEKFNTALYEAGLQDVMDLKTEQLQAWLDTQK